MSDEPDATRPPPPAGRLSPAPVRMARAVLLLAAGVSMLTAPAAAAPARSEAVVTPSMLLRAGGAGTPSGPGAVPAPAAAGAPAASAATEAEPLLRLDQRERPKVSLDEAVAKVRARFEGKVIRAETVYGSRGEPVHNIKLLSPDGRVRTIRVDGRTGRIR